MFNPYQQYQNLFQPNILPQQQIVQVNGKASVDTIQLAPNSSILVMDTSAPIVWMCVSDGVGKVTATPYDISIHKETPPPDLNNIEDRISAIEKTIAEMESKYAKPDDAKFKHKQGYANDTSNQGNR